MRVINHDLNFGLDICICVRNLYLGLGIVFRRCGCYMQVLGLGQVIDQLYISPSWFGSCPPSRFRTGPLLFIGHESCQPVSKQAAGFETG